MRVVWALLWSAAAQVVYVHDALPVSGQSSADGYEIPHLLAAVSGFALSLRVSFSFYFIS